MNCYYHQSKAAVGICKNCQKGLCAECAVDVGNGLACKNSCETQVLAINNFYKQGESQFRRIESSYKLSTMWTGVLGGIVTVLSLLGFLFYSSLILPNSLLFVLGLSLLAYANKNRKNEKGQSS